jgi:hypothetical protein
MPNMSAPVSDRVAYEEVRYTFRVEPRKPIRSLTNNELNAAYKAALVQSA